MRLFGRWRDRCWPGGAAWGRECRRRRSVLPPNLSDTAASSQDGSSLEFIAPIAGRQCASIWTRREILRLLYAGFSQNWPTRPVWSSSWNVCIYVPFLCYSPRGAKRCWWTRCVQELWLYFKIELPLNLNSCTNYEIGFTANYATQFVFTEYLRDLPCGFFPFCSQPWLVRSDVYFYLIFLILLKW